MVNYFIIALYVFITSAALILLKLGTDGGILAFGDNSATLNMTPLAAIGVMFYGVSFLIYTILISRFDLGFIVSVTTALVYVIVFLTSFILFEEQFTVFKIVGILLILGGLLLLNSGSPPSGQKTKK